MHERATANRLRTALGVFTGAALAVGGVLPVSATGQTVPAHQASHELQSAGFDLTPNAATAEQEFSASLAAAGPNGCEAVEIGNALGLGASQRSADITPTNIHLVAKRTVTNTEYPGEDGCNDQASVKVANAHSSSVAFTIVAGQVPASAKKDVTKTHGGYLLKNEVISGLGENALVTTAHLPKGRIGNTFSLNLGYGVASAVNQYAAQQVSQLASSIASACPAGTSESTPSNISGFTNAIDSAATKAEGAAFDVSANDDVPFTQFEQDENTDINIAEAPVTAAANNTVTYEVICVATPQPEPSVPPTPSPTTTTSSTTASTTPTSSSSESSTTSTSTTSTPSSTETTSSSSTGSSSSTESTTTTTSPTTTTTTETTTTPSTTSTESSTSSSSTSSTESSTSTTSTTTTTSTTSTSSPVYTYTAGSVGYDISWPNCGEASPTGGAFGFVGVGDGKDFSRNPCVGTQISFFTNPALYAPTGWYGDSTHISDTYPKTCTPGNALCEAYNYGWDEAEDAEQAASNVGYFSPTWMMDMEPVGVNTWSSNTSQNRQSLQGEYDGLTALGASTIIMYGTTVGWNTLTDNWMNNWQSDGATSVTTAAEAATYCTGHEFTGGPTDMIQFQGQDPEGDDIDEDYVCTDFN